MLIIYHCNILSILQGGLDCRHCEQAVLRTTLPPLRPPPPPHASLPEMRPEDTCL